MHTRQRGHSFYEDEAENGGSSTAPIVPPKRGGSASPSRPGSAEPSDGRASTDSEASGGAGSNSRDSGEGDSFVSIDSSGGGSEELEEEDDQAWSRGRSRSRSICGGSPEAPDMGGAPGIIKYDPSNPPPRAGGSGENKDVPPVPKSGPLAQHEIQVLKKGLEEATLTRPKEKEREEEEERLAAATEKRDRVEQKSSTPAYTMGSESQNMRRWKILMLGDSGVGKSSLIMRWTMDQFLPSLVGTVGVNFKSKKLTIGQEAMQVQVWDTAGQEQFHKITTSYYRGAHGIMLIYDVSDRASFGNIEYWVKNIKAHAGSNVHVALVGNKTDLRQIAKEQNQAGRCVELSEGQSVADRFSVPYFEVSAKDNSNVDSAFMTVVKGIIAGDGEPAGAGAGAGADKKSGAAGLTPNGGGAGAGGKDGAAKKGTLSTIFGRTEKSAASKGGGTGVGEDSTGTGTGTGKDKKDCSIS